jgi:hypothetical protein
MFTNYFEIDSTFRDRTAFPSPADFEVRISQSGRRDSSIVDDSVFQENTSAYPAELLGTRGRYDTSAQTIDPVSYAMPANTWRPVRTSVVVTVAADRITELGNSSLFVFSDTATDPLQRQSNFYRGLTANNISSDSQRRIVEYEFLGVQEISPSVFIDRGRIVVNPKFTDSGVESGDLIFIADTSDFANQDAIQLFVPNGATLMEESGTVHFYISNHNENNVIARIGSFNAELGSVVVTNPAGNASPWTNTHVYSIRRAPALLTTTIAGVTGLNELTLSTVNDPGTRSGEYVSFFLRIRENSFSGGTNVAPGGQVRQIIRYFPNRRVVLKSGFTQTPAVGAEVEILQLSHDNVCNVDSSLFLISAKNTLLNVELVNLTLPTKLLSVSTGGSVISLPYVYVLVENPGSSEGGTGRKLQSNNPYAATFRAILDTSCIPWNSGQAESRFLVSRTPDYAQFESTGNAQPMFLSDNQTLRFRILLPDGSVLDTIGDENQGPEEPNPLIQINALFSVSRS